MTKPCFNTNCIDFKTWMEKGCYNLNNKDCANRIAKDPKPKPKKEINKENEKILNALFWLRTFHLKSVENMDRKIKEFKEENQDICFYREV